MAKVTPRASDQGFSPRDEPGADFTLVERARDDRAAFGPLYDRYVDRVYRYAHARTSNHADAEDVTAETFRRAIESLDRYEWRGTPFGHWLLRVATNVLHERARAATSPLGRSRPTDLDDDVEVPDGDPAAIDSLIQREEASALWRLVGGLPQDAQRVLVLRFAWDLSYDAIAPRLGRSANACKQLAYRALKDLRQRAVDEGLWTQLSAGLVGDRS